MNNHHGSSLIELTLLLPLVLLIAILPIQFAMSIALNVFADQITEDYLLCQFARNKNCNKNISLRISKVKAKNWNLQYSRSLNELNATLELFWLNYHITSQRKINLLFLK